MNTDTPEKTDNSDDPGLSDVLNSVMLGAETKIKEMGTIARLVAAETRLALSKVRYLLVCAVLLFFSILMTWLLAILLAYQYFLVLEFSPIIALLILLTSHLLLCVTLILTAFNVGKKLTLPLSREALSPTA